MSRPPGGSARAQWINSIDELGRSLDGVPAASVPAAPSVKVVHLPDVLPPKPRRRAAAAGGAAWWVEGEAAKPTPAVEPPLVAVIGELDAPPRRRPALPINVRVFTSAAVAVAVMLSVTLYAAWAITSHESKAPQAKTAPKPAEPLPAPPATNVVTAREADAKLAELEKKYNQVVAQLDASKANLSAPVEAVIDKPTPKEEPVVEAPVACKNGVCNTNNNTYGTAVKFVGSPLEAAEDAIKSKKLMMILTISGNFEEAKFT